MKTWIFANNVIAQSDDRFIIIYHYRNILIYDHFFMTNAQMIIKTHKRVSLVLLKDFVTNENTNKINNSIMNKYITNFLYFIL